MVIGTLGYSSGLLQTVDDILGTNRDSKGLLESPQNSFGLLVIHEIADFLGLCGTPWDSWYSWGLLRTP